MKRLSADDSADSRVKVGHRQANIYPKLAPLSSFLAGLFALKVTHSCDHVTVRSWPLFRASDLFQGVIKSFWLDKRSIQNMAKIPQKPAVNKIEVNRV